VRYTGGPRLREDSPSPLPFSNWGVRDPEMKRDMPKQVRGRLCVLTRRVFLAPNLQSHLGPLTPGCQGILQL
jgi:hypothetical protein